MIRAMRYRVVYNCDMGSPEEVGGLLEVRADGVDLVDEILAGGGGHERG